jgi:hypothetical protein
MTKGSLVIVITCIFLVILGALFVLRPGINGPSNETVTDSPVASTTVMAAPRGAQFFEANIGEARRVAAACRDGAIRGDECANAETAIITVESRERFKRFRTEQ